MMAVPVDGPFLITGAGGQLGTYLRQQLAEDGAAFVGIGSRATEGVDYVVDIADSSAVDDVFDVVKPSVVIHGAAYTDVDGCERDPERADAVNHRGARAIAEAAKRTGAYVLAVGTDFVFSGTKGSPYSERSEPDPVSVYGSSKLAGERAVLETDPSFAVARTAWVYGGTGKHFPRTVLGVVASRGKMSVVDDETSCPTFAGDLGAGLIALAAQRPSGIFHLTNEGAVSRYEFARAIMIAAGKDPDLISPISTEEFLAAYPLPAKRPANSALENHRAAELGVRLPDWRASLQAYIPRLVKDMGDA
ncbi:MAG: dTDP-4-dehydrorhamnose reductase [uncultured Thermomicrobiales bacterium]|uniref:dTDP-4-dehydrorhamnose reductase n=1 Tax=uncultured Thermomicrobiales bacterium TaxID=1645740 RepID=A0A6J4UII9_9BACT|nr:MAG: dTDP-4-dehydrorhamnose reductase [uncultured Thermomicrobiales bacterium]